MRKGTPVFIMLPCLLLLVTSCSRENTSEPLSNKSPNAPSYPHPSDKEDSVSIHTFLGWSCSDPDFDLLTYSICLGTNQNPPLLVDGIKNRFYVPDPLTDTTMYYWKVVACDEQGATTSSPVWQFSTLEFPGNNVPNLPSNPYPEDGATGIAPPVTLTWTCSDPDGDALTYHLYWGITKYLENYALDLDTSAYTLLNLTFWAHYYWKVIAEDEHGAATEGPLWEFDAAMGTTNHPPEVPSNPSPPDGAIGLDPNGVILSWVCSDPDGDELSYDVYWGTNPDIMLDWTFNLNSPSHLLSDLEEETLYYWRVIARDGDFSTEGPIWSFTTGKENEPPSKPSNPSPPDNATGLNTSAVTLSWECSDPDGDYLTYSVSWGTTPQMGNVSPILPYNSWTLINLESGTQYYWQVTAKDEHSAGTLGPVWTFRTRESIDSLQVPIIIDGYFGYFAAEIQDGHTQSSYSTARENCWSAYTEDTPSLYTGMGGGLVGQTARFSLDTEPYTDYVYVHNWGYYSSGTYSLPSKEGYSSAKLRVKAGTMTSNSDIILPFTLEFYVDGVKAGEIPFEATPGSIIYYDLEIPLEWAAVKTGMNVPVEFRSDRFMYENPLPIGMPADSSLNLKEYLSLVNPAPLCLIYILLE